jgi:hypothetical protein
MIKNINTLHGRMARSPIALAVAAALLAAPAAQAIQFNNDELEGSWDTTVSYGLSVRTTDAADSAIAKSQFNPTLALQVGALTAQGRFAEAQQLQLNARGTFSANGDDGNLNYRDAGDIISNAAKITSELSLRWRSWGAFMRGTAFHDFENNGKDVLSSEAKDKVGEDAKLLDFFLFKDFTFAEQGTGTIRLGRQVVSWGESTFIQGGINVINPVDVNALRVAGAELKEAFLPIDMVYTSLSIDENWSIEALYMFEFEQIDVDAPGTFFSTNDFAGDGGRFAMLGFGTTPQPVNNPDLFNDVCRSGPGGFALSDTGLPPNLVAVGCSSALPRGLNRTAKDSGQFGAAIKYYSPELGDTEFGLYYLRYHSRLPLLSGVAVANSNASSGQVVVEYPEDINLFGLSWNTTLPGGWAFQGELSYRDNLPIQVDDVELLFAGLSPLNAAIPQPFLQFKSQLGQFAPGEFIRGYDRQEVSQLQSTFTKLYQQVLGSDQLAVVGEVGFTNFWNLPSQDVLRFQGDGTNTGGGADLITGDARNPVTQTNGFPTSFSWGYRVATRAEYNNAIGAWTVAPRVAFNHDVNGISPGPGGNFIEKRKSITLGSEFIYLNQWVVDLSYTNFFGAGSLNSLRDRDFASFSVRYSF